MENLVKQAPYSEIQDGSSHLIENRKSPVISKVVDLAT
jgi:hypothetical protein